MQENIFKKQMLHLTATDILAILVTMVRSVEDACSTSVFFKLAVFNFLGSFTSCNDIKLFVSSFSTSFALQCKPLNID